MPPGDDIVGTTERDKFDLQAALDLARWQGATDARLAALEVGQMELTRALKDGQKESARAIGAVDTKLDSLTRWMLTAAVSCLASAAVTVAAVVLGK